MEIFRVNLNPLVKNYKYQPLFFVIMGLLYSIIGLFRLSSSNSELDDWIWIVGGIFFLIGAYYLRNNESKYFFEINNDSIQFRQTISKPKHYLFSEISAIHFKPISILLSLTNGLNEEISLGNVGYKNVLDIKTELKEIAVQKGIQIK